MESWNRWILKLIKNLGVCYGKTRMNVLKFGCTWHYKYYPSVLTKFRNSRYRQLHVLHYHGAMSFWSSCTSGYFQSVCSGYLIISQNKYIEGTIFGVKIIGLCGNDQSKSDLSHCFSSGILDNSTFPRWSRIFHLIKHTMQLKQWSRNKTVASSQVIWSNCTLSGRAIGGLPLGSLCRIKYLKRPSHRFCYVTHFIATWDQIYLTVYSELISCLGDIMG